MTDPITEANERQSQYFAENPRDESITHQAGFAERYELMLAELEETE